MNWISRPPMPSASQLSGSSEDRHLDTEADGLSGGARHSGALIINADDWGRDEETTDRTLDCFGCGTISSVSAMMFMNDSERAAAISRERGIDAGLHLNFTTPFSASGSPMRLIEHQLKLSRYLRRHRMAQIVFHPGLVSSFEYVVAAQLAEYCRLYAAEPKRIDGHHHMHLCSNMVLQKLLPAGTLVRRNFSFGRGEKSFFNRFYRRILDGALKRRHLLSDFLFSLPPLEPDRLRRIFSLAHEFSVEIETHPVNPAEYRFLAGGEIVRWARGLQIAASYTLQDTRSLRR